MKEQIPVPADGVTAAPAPAAFEPARPAAEDGEGEAEPPTSPQSRPAIPAPPVRAESVPQAVRDAVGDGYRPAREPQPPRPPVPTAAGGEPGAPPAVPQTASPEQAASTPAGRPAVPVSPPQPPKVARDQRPNALLDEAFGVEPPAPPPTPLAGPVRPRYTVRSMDTAGQLHTDTVEADSPEAAKAQFIEQGRFVLGVKDEHVTRDPERAYRAAATGTGRFGSPAAFADQANAGIEEAAVAREVAGRQRNAAAFDAAVGGLPRAHKALLGGVIGGVRGYRTATAAGRGGVGRAASAGAASGAVEAAGGPVGIALAVAEMKDKAVQAAVDGIEGLGKTAQKVAGNDGLGLFKDASAAAVKGLEAIPVVGEQFAVPLKIAAATVVAFSDAANAFVERGRQLAAYDGNLAGAAARQDVARLQADIREAQQTGPALAKLTDTVTSFEVATREALGPIKEVVIETLAGTLGSVKLATEGFLMLLSNPSRFVPDSVTEYFKKVLEAIQKPTDEGALIDDWINAADGLGADPIRPGAVRPGSDRIAPLPIFQR